MDFAKKEQEILDFWEKNEIFQKLQKKNQNNKNWSFLDGPITANNAMGVHHAWGRTYKDLFQRFKAMQGYNQRFQNGFDCQGLWVEVEVEKEKGFKCKKDIENYGVAKFIQDCKNRVLKYSKIQQEQSIRLGQWMNWENSYYTMSEENNYAIWGFLKKCKEKGLLYKGKDVVPWCLRCGTAISQHEILTEDYREITHQSVFVKCKLLDEENLYLLVWTTTPWTLVANTALAVHPDLIYVVVKDNDNNKFIVLKEKKDLIKGVIEKEIQGKDLRGKKYEPILEGPIREVVLWKDVNTEEGTGIVHVAPGCGQEDFKLSKELNLEVIDPVDDEACYRQSFLKGKRVDQANDLVFDKLKDKIFRIENYKHRYPVCWRCKTELIFRLVPEWYISMQKLRKYLIKISQQIKWIPNFGLDREIDWLKNMQDWLISKKRYWGLALPIFECSCGSFEVIGSKKELKERTISGWKENQSPHKPWLDEIKIECSKCKKLVSRIPDVGNPWLDAGIVPFSTMGYYENKKEWSKWFPVNLVCESFPGQFKNWFYSLIVMSFVLEKQKPVKTIFGYATVKDEKGNEMHKSAGNSICISEAIKKMGADPIRWAYTKQNPGLNLLFGYKKIQENQRKLMILENIFIFFKTYLNKEKIKSSNSKNTLDEWIISRLNNLILNVTEALEQYDAYSASLFLENFFINDLSLWYLRRSRKRIQQEESAGYVFYQVLLTLNKLIAPIIPFFAEYLYSFLKTENMSESIHLQDWPRVDKRKINKEIEEVMEKTRDLVTKAMSERAKLGIKTRQPLLELKIKENLLPEFQEILKQEVNVKRITIDKDFWLNPEITSELEQEGLIREIIRQIQSLRKKSNLKPENKITIYCFGSSEINELIKKNQDLIKKETIATELFIKENQGLEIIKGLKINVIQA
ncbi:MAG: isoleucine--tRNA ligase [Candidatus Pacebacteria bacterium]|nr:isoleucine--tRNA ligase [Candidatus Paceibacterota bacterium]